MADKYDLIPAFDDDENETGYYTRVDGVSGMTVSALAIFNGVKQPVITNLLNNIRDSDPISNDLPECLKPFAGQELRLISNDLQGRMIIVDEVCQVITEYYVFDARTYQGKSIAQNNFRAISKAGMRLFIWSKTGYKPSGIQKDASKPVRESYWYKRLGVAMSDEDNPLQAGYFCVYLEMMRFFSELENRLGYVIEDINFETNKYIIPDISIGKCFNNFLRSDNQENRDIRREFLNSEEQIDFRPGGKHNFEISKYNHVFPEESHGKNNIQPVTAYPNKYKSIFHHYLEETYIPDRCFKYIKDRDPKGIEGIKQTLSIMSDKKKDALSGTLVGRFIKGLLPPSK